MRQRLVVKRAEQKGAAEGVVVLVVLDMCDCVGGGGGGNGGDVEGAWDYMMERVRPDGTGRGERIGVGGHQRCIHFLGLYQAVATGSNVDMLFVSQSIGAQHTILCFWGCEDWGIDFQYTL